MTVFVVVAQDNPNTPNLPSAIATNFAASFLQLNEKVWLVATKGTAKDLSDKLKVTDGTNGAAVIIEAANYYGRANTNIWSWIKDKWELTANG